MKSVSHNQTKLPLVLALLFALPSAVALLILAVDPGGGHPPLGAVLVDWTTAPTLSRYLSRALTGSDFPSPVVMLLGLMEWALVGFGLGSIIVRLQGWTATDLRGRLGMVAFVGYLTAQLGAHAALNLQAVNLRLLSRSPAVSEAAVERIRQSGDSGSVPALQQKLIEELETREFPSETNLIDTLTQLGGAKGWQDLLESGRLGVADRDARTWRGIIHNVREMTNPLYADARGGAKSPYLGSEAVARLSDALALRLSQHLTAIPDSEASLTLLTVMKGRPDLCSKYFSIVPNGLRGAFSQATLDVVGNLAAIRSGRPPDSVYNYEALLPREEIVRVSREQTVVADEWAAWARSDASPCRSQ